MALQKQPLQINFGGGLDTKSDPWQIAMTNFLELENNQFDTTGQLSKRNGFAQITGIAENSQTTLATFNDGLVALGTDLQAYSEDTGQWFNRGSVQPLDLAVQSAVRESVAQTVADAAFASNSLACVVYTNTGGQAYYQINDTTTGQIILDRVALPATAVFGRVFVLGNYFVVTFLATVSGSTHLQYVSIPIFNPTAGSAAVDIATDVNNLSAGYDGSVSSNLYLAYNASDGGGAVRVKYLTPQLGVSSTVAITGRTATRVSIAIDGGTNTFGQPIVWVTYYASTNAYSTGFSASLVVLVAEVQTITAETVPNLTSTAIDGVLSLFYQVQTTYTYGSIRSDLIRKKTLTDGGTLSASSVVIRSVALASKALYSADNDLSYFLGVYGGTIQPTYFLISSDGKIVSRLAGANAAGYPVDQVLASLNLVGSTMWCGYLLKTLLAPLNKGIDSDQTANVYAQTGVNLASFTMQDVRSVSAEIGKSLHLSGGVLWQYDGVKPVELGFHVFPEDLNLAESNTGSGAMTVQQYWYYVTYEWTDGQGIIHRSAPSVATTITVTGSNDTVTLKIPTLRLTQKLSPNSVKICIYRYSVGQPIPYMVTSVATPLLNDPSVDEVTYVDIAADSSILGNLILYTFGGVVENICPPASKSIDLYKSRLFLLDAEDRNRIWYSKQVIEGTPVEMSDLFTLYAAPTTGSQGSTGPGFCLAPMDDKNILFKENSIYYFTGDGPDNTGANNDFSEVVFITGTVGCTNQQSIVFTPNGLMFQTPGKGIWVLGRDLSTKYIGAPVERYNDLRVLSAVQIPNTNQVRFTVESGLTLVYDYYFDQWASFTGIPAQSSVIYRNLHTYLNSLGQVFQENPGSFKDGSKPVNMRFKTAWIKVAGLQGFQRAYFMYLLGRYITPHKLIVDVAYDYADASLQTGTLLPTNFNPVYGADPYYGSGSPYGGENSVEQFRLFFTRQKCQSIQITVKEQYDASKGAQAGEGLTLSGMNFVVGLKGVYPRLNPSQSTS
jgi:hypothetical protein